MGETKRKTNTVAFQAKAGLEETLRTHGLPELLIGSIECFAF